MCAAATGLLFIPFSSPWCFSTTAEAIRYSFFFFAFRNIFSHDFMHPIGSAQTEKQRKKSPILTFTGEKGQLKAAESGIKEVIGAVSQKWQMKSAGVLLFSDTSDLGVYYSCRVGEDEPFPTEDVSRTYSCVCFCRSRPISMMKYTNVSFHVAINSSHYVAWLQRP